jgi:hypothetical protein
VGTKRTAKKGHAYLERSGGHLTKNGEIIIIIFYFLQSVKENTQRRVAKYQPLGG